MKQKRHIDEIVTFLKPFGMDRTDIIKSMQTSLLKIIEEGNPKNLWVGEFLSTIEFLNTERELNWDIELIQK